MTKAYERTKVIGEKNRITHHLNHAGSHHSPGQQITIHVS